MAMDSSMSCCDSMDEMSPEENHAAAGDHYMRAAENHKMAAQTMDKGKRAHHAHMAHAQAAAGDDHADQAAKQYAQKSS